MAMVPPCGMASTSLKIRFVSISRMPAASPRMTGTSTASVMTTRMLTPRPSASLFQRGCVSAAASSRQRRRSTAMSGELSPRSR